jgi:hypothetical protein
VWNIASAVSVISTITGVDPIAMPFAASNADR